MDLEATLLKPMMVMPGADAQSKASPEDVSCATLDALRRSAVPHAPDMHMRTSSARVLLCMLWTVRPSGLQPFQDAHAGP